MTIDEIYKIAPNSDGWRKLPNGNNVKLGNWVVLGDDVLLGNNVLLGEGVVLGEGVKLGDGWNSNDLNAAFRAAYQKPTIFWKWVTSGRMSPNFDGGTPVAYPAGAVVEVPDAVISDVQCAAGLHVLRPGYRPEWAGLCSPGHSLVCLEVEVQPEDIMFAGTPGNDAKIRVRKLKVLS